MGRGEKSLLSDPGSELRLGRDEDKKEKRTDIRWDEARRRRKKYTRYCFLGEGLQGAHEVNPKGPGVSVRLPLPP